MRTKFFIHSIWQIITLLLLTLLFSCSKDELTNPTPQSNNNKQSSKEFARNAATLHLIKRIEYQSGITEEYKYNEQNKVIAMQSSDGVHYEYSYDTKGLLEYSIFVNNNTPNESFYTKYDYNNFGTKVEQLTKYKNGNVYKTKFIINDNQLPIEEIRYMVNTTTDVWGTPEIYKHYYNGKQLERTVYSDGYTFYYYDSNDNVIERKTYIKKLFANGFYLNSHTLMSFDNKKQIQYDGVEYYKNNLTDYQSETYFEAGGLDQVYSGTNSYSYNNDDYVTEQFINGVLHATYTLEKVE